MIIYNNRRGIYILVMIVILSLHCYGRNVDIIINYDEKRIAIVDQYLPELDQSIYDYISPEGLRVYFVAHADTQCVFLSPCVAEYDKVNDRCCVVYMWPRRIICPDDCFCIREDDTTFDCSRKIDDAELFMTIKLDGDSAVSIISPKVDLLQEAKSRRLYLINGIEEQMEEGTIHSALFWEDADETVMHNYLMFHLFSNKMLGMKDLELFSFHFKHFNYGQH